MLAVDHDVRVLAATPAPGLEVREMDLVSGELPRDAFDLVHTRLVLIHVPERERLLARLVAALRPGGVLLVEEDDVHPVLATAEGAYREAWLAMLRMTDDAGVDAEWARGLPERLGALGLADVVAELDGQLFRGRVGAGAGAGPHLAAGARPHRQPWACRARSSTAAARRSRIPRAGSTGR